MKYQLKLVSKPFLYVDDFSISPRKLVEPFSLKEKKLMGLAGLVGLFFLSYSFYEEFRKDAPKVIELPINIRQYDFNSDKKIDGLEAEVFLRDYQKK